MTRAQPSLGSFCMAGKPGSCTLAVSCTHQLQCPLQAASNQEYVSTNHEHTWTADAFWIVLLVFREGMEKLVRIFDLEKPAAEPLKLPPAHSGIRSVNFIQNDNTIICSYVDKPGLGCVLLGGLLGGPATRTAARAFRPTAHAGRCFRPFRP